MAFFQVFAQHAMGFRVAIVGKPVHNDSAGGVQHRDVVQQQAQELLLPESLVGKAKRVAQRKTGVKRTRRFDLLADAAGEGDGNGCDANRFNGSLDQPNGLIAQPSGGGQNGDVHTVLLEQAGHLGGGDGDQAVQVRRQNVAHEGEVTPVDRSDFVGGIQFNQTL
jgi:hypothetical protein